VQKQNHLIRALKSSKPMDVVQAQ